MTNRYHHLSALHGIELFEARLSTQSFARHSHEGFAIGAIAQGVGGYVCRGANMVLPAGSLSLMNPEEPHTGHAHSARLHYNMLYASEEAVRAVLGIEALRGFREVTPQGGGAELSALLARLAELLNVAGSGRDLAIGETVHDALALVFVIHGGARLRRPGAEPTAIAKVRDAIHEGVAEGGDISLRRLGELAQLHPSYLVRSFRRAVGISPHAYALRCRVERAKAAIIAGQSGTEAAQEAGFFDQSHMIRHMRRQIGVTPRHLTVH